MVYHAFPLGAALDVLQVLIYCSTLVGCSNLIDEFALGSEDEEGNAEHRVGSCGEDGEGTCLVSIFGEGIGNLYLSSFAAAYPVALRFLDALAPVNGVEAVEETLAVGTDTQAPLPHLLLFDGIAATDADAFHHFIVGEHGAELWAPVHHRLAQEGDAIVHQQVALSLLVGWPSSFLLELLDELLDGLSLLEFLVEI